MWITKAINKKLYFKYEVATHAKVFYLQGTKKGFVLYPGNQLAGISFDIPTIPWWAL